MFANSFRRIALAQGLLPGAAARAQSAPDSGATAPRAGADRGDSDGERHAADAAEPQRDNGQD